MSDIEVVERAFAADGRMIDETERTMREFVAADAELQRRLFQGDAGAKALRAELEGRFFRPPARWEAAADVADTPEERAELVAARKARMNRRALGREEPGDPAGGAGARHTTPPSRSG